MPVYYTFTIVPGEAGNTVTIRGYLANGVLVSTNTYDMGRYSNVDDMMAYIPLPINNGCVV
jgi:hypothetical protein